MLFCRICSIIFSFVALYIAWGAIYFVYHAIEQPFDTFGEWIGGFLVWAMIIFTCVGLIRGIWCSERGYRKIKLQKERDKKLDQFLRKPRLN
jgi:hypothetical protein